MMLKDILKSLSETEKRLDMDCAFFSILLYSDGSGKVIGGLNLEDIYCSWDDIQDAAFKISQIAIGSTGV